MTTRHELAEILTRTTPGPWRPFKRAAHLAAIRNSAPRLLELLGAAQGWLLAFCDDRCGARGPDCDGCVTGNIIAAIDADLNTTPKPC